MSSSPNSPQDGFRLRFNSLNEKVRNRVDRAISRQKSKILIQDQYEGAKTSLWPDVPYPSDGTPKGGKTCHILDLPFELRQKILCFVIGPTILHIIDMEDKIGQIRCTSSHEQTTQALEVIHCNRTCQSPLWYFASYKGLPSYKYSGGVPPLLRTCRQLHNQGIGILYSQSTFEFEYPETFVRLQKTIDPAYFITIKHLQLTGRARTVRGGHGIEAAWTEMWEIICHKMAPQTLTVYLYIQRDHSRWTTQCQSRLMEWMALPIKHLRNMKHFDLIIETCNLESYDRVTTFTQNLATLVCSSNIQDEAEMMKLL